MGDEQRIAALGGGDLGPADRREEDRVVELRHDDAERVRPRGTQRPRQCVGPILERLGGSLDSGAGGLADTLGRARQNARGGRDVDAGLRRHVAQTCGAGFGWAGHVWDRLSSRRINAPRAGCRPRHR